MALAPLTGAAGRGSADANTNLDAPKKFNDILLAFLVVAIVGLMILPLPLVVVDILVALNMTIAISLLLLAIYIPSATAFTSFPSVILISTLFRLSLSIAITRLILIEGDAGEIIDTFGSLVVGGNVVVGLVVFTIITVVQFIVIAKGTERVAEVSARFTLDAMPGKQMSIDSDLRSGLLDKDEARSKRRLLELESQLHGSMDGAMKFVKGDAIAGIIILLVNIIGGLTIGVMQHDLSLADAAHTYTILTVGDGLVAQIPALLISISAGLIITRSGDEADNLGDSIITQVSSYPKVSLLAGILAWVLATIPGFPWLVFLLIGTALLAVSLFHYHPEFVPGMFQRQTRPSRSHHENGDAGTTPRDIIVTYKMASEPLTDAVNIRNATVKAIHQIAEQYGIELPIPVVRLETQKAHESPTSFTLEIKVYGITLGKKTRPLTALDSADASVSEILLDNLSTFMGIQETANLVNRWNSHYPDLIKETLRAVTPMRMSDLFKRLLDERIPITDLRTIFETLTAHGATEKDMEVLTDTVRIALKRQITEHFCGNEVRLAAYVIHPKFEQKLLETLQSNPSKVQLQLPELLNHFQQSLSEQMDNEPPSDTSQQAILLTRSEIRRYIRQFCTKSPIDIAVLAYQELTDTVQIHPLAQVGFAEKTTAPVTV